jgi:hypothetical protein
MAIKRYLGRIYGRLLAPVLTRLERIEQVQASQAKTLGSIQRAIEGDPRRNEAIRDSLSTLIEQRWAIIDSFDDLRFGNHLFSCGLCGQLVSTLTAKQYVSQCIFKGGRLKRFECPNCGCITGPLKMLELSQEALDLDYAQHYSVFSEGDTTEDETFTFFQLQPVKGKSYLNFGCGRWSKSIDRIRSEGYDLIGYEPYSKSDVQQNVLTKKEDLSKMRFDGIFTNNLIEHLKDPIRTLSFLRSLLKDEESVMVHSTPCYEYLFEYTRFHFFFFTGNSVEFICRQVGLEAYDRYQAVRNGNPYISVKFRIAANRRTGT